MGEQLATVVEALRTYSRQLEVGELTDSDATGVFAHASEIERLASALKVLVAPVLKRSSDWARAGHRSAEEWMARTSGSAPGEVRRLVETAEKVADLQATQEALRSGGLSLTQAGAVAEAAAANPEAEAELLDLAAREAVKTLKDRARRTVLEARGSVEDRYARQRRLRSFSHWIDDEGMVAGRFRLTPDVGSAVVKQISRQADRLFRAAQREGRREPAEAHAADAFAALVSGQAAGRGRGAEVVVLVSRDALVRGQVDPDPDAGELCEIPGFGAVPVSVARDLLADCFLKAVVYDGTRISHVKHFGRHRPAEVDTALLAHSLLSRGEVRCVVEGCGRTVGIQWDHKEPFAQGGATSAANLQPMCGFDNREKHAGRVVQANDGRWRRTAGRPACQPAGRSSGENEDVQHEVKKEAGPPVTSQVVENDEAHASDSRHPEHIFKSEEGDVAGHEEQVADHRGAPRAEAQRV